MLRSDRSVSITRPVLFRLLTLGMVVSSFAGTSEARSPAAKKLQVWILCGQSNMQGHAAVTTFDAMKLRPQTSRLHQEMVNADGTPRVCDRVWISSLGSAAEIRTGKLTVGFGAEGRGPKIGPEFTFGLRMQQLTDAPILIIKTAWGGKSLNTDFRPPRGGDYEFNERQLENFARQKKDLAEIRQQRKEATGHYYRLMLDHVQSVLSDPASVCPAYDADAGFDLAGFVWFQGWNDMVDGSTYAERGQPGGYDLYSTLMAQFIRDVRRDLQTPQLPFVIGVMGAGGPTAEYGPDQQRYRSIHQTFRDAMAAPAKQKEFAGTVSAVLTEQFWDQDVTRLRAQERSLKPQQDAIRAQQKDGTITREQAEQQIEALYAKEFSSTDLTLLRTSTSNAEYHYLGSAGIMAGIGRAFADAGFALQK